VTKISPDRNTWQGRECTVKRVMFVDAAGAGTFDTLLLEQTLNLLHVVVTVDANAELTHVLTRH